MQKLGLIASMFFFHACSQTIYVKSSHPLKHVRIESSEVYQIDTVAKPIAVPYGIGPLEYSAVDVLDQPLHGKIERKDLNSWAVITALAGTLVTLPIMAFLGIVVANPEWVLFSKVQSQIAISGDAYRQYAHPETVPITAIFALIGLSPLLFLIKGERVADGVVDLH